MFTARNKGRFALGAIVVGAALALSGCAAGDPLDPGTDGGSSDAIVVGSQAYYSNEIIAEIYAQALENAGFTVEREFSIGQRDAYLPALESGEVDLFPEYTGNLLQFYDPETTATTSDDVYAALQAALPDGLTVLDQSSATDQDSYNVTAAFAAEQNLSSLADLANATVPLTLGGAPELEERPYGPKGLLEKYGVTVGFSATGDTTVEDLLAGTINIANVYSADPRIQTDDLVTLADPEGLFLASNVVPLVNAEIADEIADVINAVSAALTPEGLVALNVQSTVDQKSPADIATAWLTENGLI
ncbi:ABC transporter substrate-binding protein [Leifsonia sp. H3M29-4]|uniref:ABC transporter substrate-binding protein n=1 Tax=Salinibacterium metalliresistens TaxID=3031321 RepID=UPI0023DA1377|nr:ABC transporter substrate-binding protein [Salinibacterium metalliresistens]MDF1478844.1 ABC transporter substrate-binding protein [Salinibacterium metalliresistens]